VGRKIGSVILEKPGVENRAAAAFYGGRFFGAKE
jgi:hypothetical protein